MFRRLLIFERMGRRHLRAVQVYPCVTAVELVVWRLSTATN